MKHLYLYMVLLATLLFVGCGSVGSSADVKREEVREPEVVMRYGVNVEGYELRCCTLRKSETMSDIMKQYGRSATDVHRVERASVDVFPLRKMRVGNDYTIFLKSDSLGRSRVEYVAYEIDKFQYVLFVMCGDSIGVQRGSKPVKIVQQSRSVKIESSLMGAIKSSSLPYELGVDIGNIFQWSVDLFSLRRGDSFRVIYDEEFVDDSVSIGIGRIKGAAFYHNNKLNYAIPFEQDGKIQYWDQDGGSLRMQMLKSPLRYSRSNSHQSSVRSSQRDGRSSNMEVYYAAPTGTPIHSVGDGVVSFVGQEEIDGKTVKIRHSNGVESG
ncbi:MAG: peptidoglycan DD-metalloendopeptidase family protein, partial [Rikenellaceae bacterium]